MKKCFPLLALPIVILVVLCIGPSGPAAGKGSGSGSEKERAFGIPKRIPWTTSTITGTPEPPHPYRLEPIFPKLKFRNPLLMTVAPGSKRFFVGEQAGKLYSFPNDPNCEKADLFLDLTKELSSWDKDGKVKGVEAVYALAFHPQFEKNRYCYICYVLSSKTGGEHLPDGTRISRFKVTETDPPRCDPKSEQVIITWLAGGHNGCDLQFGPDGFLYISTGDATSPNPPDALHTGQDVSDLLSSILRIDVDRPEKDRAYSIPADNPFIKTPDARPEIWSYGFRNPWRMSFDRKTGDLWVGDVGWELWEMVYRIQRGGNYGWSFMEGRQVVRPEGKRGPTPVLPPTIEFPHTEASSITGGYVYRGKKYKDLVGTYICGDWVTRKMWGTRFDGDKMVEHRELAQTAQRIVSFCQDHDGELYVVNYDEEGNLFQLAPNPQASEKPADFPRVLSRTGLFSSTKDHTPAPGVIPFSIASEQWADHTTAQRFLALPPNTSAQMFDNNYRPKEAFIGGRVFFPKDGVLVKTISLEMERGNPKSSRCLETQILHFNGIEWRGYSYRWNDDQTDAVLVTAGGEDIALNVKDAQAPGGKRKQTWHIASRTECLTCHNPWTGYTLGFTLPQLNVDHDYNGTVDNQLRALQHAGLIELLHNDDAAKTNTPMKSLPKERLAHPHDEKADINVRARAYLQTNCAHCHQFGAGGTADLDMRFSTALNECKILDVRPGQGTFGIAGAKIVASGDPFASVLYYRMAKIGHGRMPHIGSEMVDERGLQLIHDWIRQLPIHKTEQALIQKLRGFDEPAVLAAEKANWEQSVQKKAQEIARQQKRDKPTAEDLAAAEKQVKTKSGEDAGKRAAERTTIIQQLLATTSGALILSRTFTEESFPAFLKPEILTASQAHPDGQIRDLFERFLPDEQRVQRLGSAVRPEQILKLKGDSERGKKLFFNSAGLQCVNCHRIAGNGSTLGPDLSDLGKRQTRPEILESILTPSKKIDPKYVTYIVETTDGKVHTGLLGDKNDREVVLKIAGDKDIRIPTNKSASIAPQLNSIMPELLLRDLTADQAADLLEFLSGLK